MGRLIDIDVLFDYFGDDAIDETTRSNIEYFVSEKGTVQAIPKADYENRLKADLVAMLTEIQLDIEKHTMTSGVTNQGTWNECIACCSRIIDGEINSLKGKEHDAIKM